MAWLAFVGRLGRLMEVVEQQHRLALLDVSEFDAIGKPGFSSAMNA